MYKVTRGAPVKFRQILVAIVIVGTIWQAAAAQQKKVDLDVPPMEVVLAGSIMQSNLVLSD
jgi:hypothetical protein